MLFSSVLFVVLFLPTVLIIYYTLLRKSRKAQNVFLLIASLGFYAWGEPWFVLILIGSVLGNWLFGLIIDKHRENKARSRLIIAIMLAFNLSIIFVFKYLMFTIDNINRFIANDIKMVHIVLPIGISFFTFQAISYVIDVYRRHGEAQKNPLNVGLYISFFPQLIAGPIVRYETIADQINNREESIELFSSGVCRFLMGFGKKVLLANNFALIADSAFALSGGDLSVAFSWLGALAYTLQIYFDFSGYSDMAIGLGRMFGFKFLENFNYPYISKSISEFWRRWHISLGTWFRDYVYIPMGGSRVKTNGRLIFNLFVVWSLTGLWHGANWTFITWGLMYFVLLTFEKLTGFDKLWNEKLGLRLFKHFYTLILVMIGWVFFRAENITYALMYLKNMFFLGDTMLIDNNAINCFRDNQVFLFFGIMLSMPVFPLLRDKVEERVHNGNHVLSGFATIVYPALVMVTFFLAMSYLVKGTYNPFIYFNF